MSIHSFLSCWQNSRSQLNYLWNNKFWRIRAVNLKVMHFEQIGTPSFTFDLLWITTCHYIQVQYWLKCICPLRRELGERENYSTKVWHTFIHSFTFFYLMKYNSLAQIINVEKIRAINFSSRTSWHWKQIGNISSIIWSDRILTCILR